MSRTYLPSKESELLIWSTNFSTLINDDPTIYGLGIGEATAYAGAHAAFVAAHRVANEPTTRSPANIAIKTTKKDELIALTRSYVNIIQAYPGTNNDMRTALGITVRDTQPTPVPVPADAPHLEVQAVIDHRVSLRLHGDDPTSRAKPQGVQGATIFTHIGTSTPADIQDWTFHSTITRTRTTVDFPPTTEPGAKVWFTAFWFNTKGEQGPTCQPVSTRIGEGLGQLPQAA